VTWGENWAGQTIVGERNAGFVAVAVGTEHTLALNADGTISGWGFNNQIYGPATVPTPDSDFVAIAAGGGWAVLGLGHSLGLKINQTIIGWGSNYVGQTAVPESENANFVAIAAGAGHSVGLKSDGSIVAWGSNNSGQTGIPEPNSGFTRVAAGDVHSLGLKGNGSVIAWGSNGAGQTEVPDPNSGFVSSNTSAVCNVAVG